jgi:hypothetical protein
MVLERAHKTQSFDWVPADCEIAYRDMSYYAFIVYDVGRSKRDPRFLIVFFVNVAAVLFCN